MSKLPKTLMAAVAAFVLSGTAAVAHADSSFSFDVQGEVNGVCEAVNESIDPVESIDLDDTSEQALGDITYQCNNPNGFTRTISSANSGILTDGTTDIEYLVAHGGDNGLSFAAEQLTAPKVTNHPASEEFVTGQTGSFSVQVPSVPENMTAGTYADTITVAVNGN